MKTSIVLNPAMGSVVIDRLREFGDLPTRGIVAGQAVDSALTDLFGTGGGVYNDVDVFRNVPGGPAQADRAVSTTARSRLCARPVSGYSGMSLMLELVQSYYIKSVSRNGMVNYVNCSMGSGHLRERLSAEAVIAGFDINCTHVAVDLATKRLVWDSAYEDYLRSRQLNIVMMHTPWHTFLRLAKKARELPGVYVNMEAAAQACVGVAQSKFITRMLQDKDVSMLFGKKHQELAESLRSDWEPYFNLAQQVWRSKTPHGGWSEARADETLGDTHKQYTLWQLTPRTPLDSAVQKRMDRLQKGVLVYAGKVVDEVRRVKPAAATAKLAAILAQRREAVPAKRRDTDLVTLCAQLFETDYVQGQALTSVAAKVASWVDKHSAFNSALLGMSLAQQWETIARIQEVCQRVSEDDPELTPIHALGILETQAKAEDIKSPSRMLKIIKDEMSKGREPFGVAPLKVPTVIPSDYAGFSVTELLTPVALKLEGLEMHHCVGGYTDAVRSGRSRILRIRHSSGQKSWNSTVEVLGRFHASKCADMQLRVAQNRTVQNKEPSQENRRFVEFVMTYLSMADELTDDLAQQAQAASQLVEDCSRKAKSLAVKIDELTALRSRLVSESHALEEELGRLKKREALLAEYAKDLPKPEPVVPQLTYVSFEESAEHADEAMESLGNRLSRRVRRWLPWSPGGDTRH